MDQKSTNSNLASHLLSERESGIVNSFTDERIASKLMAMGVLPGSKIEIIRIAPFGGGFYIKVDGHGLAIRKKEAEAIVLEM